MSYFKILFNAIDVTDELKNFDSRKIPFGLTTTDKMLIGYYKTFTSFYMYLPTPSVQAGELVLKYYNGTEWKALDYEATYNDFTKSSFIYFVFPEDAKKYLADGEELYYLELSSNSDLDSATELGGLNVLFSCDEDIEKIRSNIVTDLNDGLPWILKHEAARDLILQTIRNKGNIKIVERENTTGLSGLTYSDIQPQDFLDVRQVKLASAYLAISMIYLDELSDENDDKYERRGYRYSRKSNELLNTFFLKLDSNDSGDDDEAVAQVSSGSVLTWV